MKIRNVRKSLILTVVLLGLITAIVQVVKVAMAPAPPETFTYQIAAGNLSRTVILERGTRKGKQVTRKPVDHLEFRSTNGPVRVEIFPFNAQEDPAPAPAEEKPTPPEPIASAEGEFGKIDMSQLGPNQNQFVIQLRPELDSDITVVLYSAP